MVFCFLYSKKSYKSSDQTRLQAFLFQVDRLLESLVARHQVISALLIVPIHHQLEAIACRQNCYS
jgi:hypothetical protein